LRVSQSQCPAHALHLQADRRCARRPMDCPAATALQETMRSTSRACDHRGATLANSELPARWPPVPRTRHLAIVEIRHRDVAGCWPVALHQPRHVRVHLVAAYGELFSESYHVGREPLSKDPFRRMKATRALKEVTIYKIIIKETMLSLEGARPRERDREIPGICRERPAR
jgi:hypothetical protein